MMGRRARYIAPYYPLARAEPSPPPPLPLEYQLVNLLRGDGITDSEIEAIRTVLMFVVANRKAEAIAREASEIEALKHDLERSMSRENCYLNALMEISNSEGPAGEIASTALYGASRTPDTSVSDEPERAEPVAEGAAS